jgi:peptidyl-prolyl cis-trans isomerase B (cyclophilin B)
MAAPVELPQAFSNLPQLQGTATILLTVKGKPIKLQVDGQNAPITAGNFVDLVQKNVYDGLVFHRVVKQPEPFVVQGGDPQGRDPNVPVGQLGTGGYIDPDTQQERRIPLEIKPASATKTLYETTFSTAGLTEKPLLTHKRGALAMARSADPNSASSQFYITLADQNFLDGEYAVFGYVTEGMDVVDNIQQGDRIDAAKVLEIKGEFKPGK